MRIGLVVPGFSAAPADWCIPALRHLARALAAHADVRVIAIRYPYQAARYPIDGAETIALGGGVRHAAGTLSVWRTALDVLRHEHRQRPFDVLHAFWATESGLLAALAGRLLHVPTLVSLAGGELVALRDINYGDQRIAWERIKVAASLRLASGVSAGSHQLASVARLHLKREPVHVAPLGVDLELFSPTPAIQATSNDDGPRLVHVGTLTPVKDHATLLRALAACITTVNPPPWTSSATARCGQTSNASPTTSAWLPACVSMARSTTPVYRRTTGPPTPSSSRRGMRPNAWPPSRPPPAPCPWSAPASASSPS